MFTAILAIVALVALVGALAYVEQDNVSKAKQAVELKVFPPFLATFAAYDGTGDKSKPAFKGVNNAAPLVVQHELEQALVAADTLTMQAPAGFYDWVPQLVGVFTIADPRVSQIANIAITNHDKDTGVTTLTASGGVSDDAQIVLAYYPCTLGTA